LIAVVALVLVMLAFPSAAWGAGQLDPSFDGDGKVRTDFSVPGTDAFDTAFGVATQADGKIVAVGQSSDDFALARYNLDGNLDSTFDGDGKVLTNFGSGDVAYGVAIQPDGKIVAVGTTVAADDFAIARYNPDGSLDTTFDGDGRVLTNFDGQSDSANAVAIQPDSKIVVAGSTCECYFSFDMDFALARYNPDGTLDTTFDGDGKLTTGFGVGDSASGVAIQSDGKIVAAGSSCASCDFAELDQDFALARYNPDGSRDSSFSGDGRLTTDISGVNDAARDVAIQADGKIVAAGMGNYPAADFALARYNADGSLDPGFSGDGRVLTDFGRGDDASGVAIQANGKIIAAGTRNGGPSSDFVLARYKPDGNLDPSFGSDGKVLTDFGGSEDHGNDVAIQPDGKIVVGGSTGASDFALARYIATSPQISINDATRLEGNAGLTAFTFTVSVSAPSSQTITVSRRTVDGSAAAGSDYTALASATFTFSPGQTTKTATVKVKGDVAVEPDETFFVNLSNPTNATIADGQGRGTILNDDLSASASCTITGTNQDDVINGTPGNDVICGRKGDDQINGLDGADVLKGEDGNDLLVGGNAVDLLIGAGGVDDLRGESDNDTLRGGDNGDTLNGGLSSDALSGDAGADSLNIQDGVAANDSADGGSESDSCVFDSGDFVTNCP
jgi:uncharacterized delta-60 repeat protein